MKLRKALTETQFSSPSQEGDQPEKEKDKGLPTSSSASSIPRTPTKKEEMRGSPPKREDSKASPPSTKSPAKNPAPPPSEKMREYVIKVIVVGEIGMRNKKH